MVSSVSATKSSSSSEVTEPMMIIVAMTTKSMASMTSKSIFMTSKSMVASPMMAMVPMVVMHFSFAFFRVATAFDATFVNIVIDFVSFVTNNNHRNTTEITTIGDLGIHARYIIEGI